MLESPALLLILDNDLYHLFSFSFSISNDSANDERELESGENARRNCMCVATPAMEDTL